MHKTLLFSLVLSTLLLQATEKKHLEHDTEEEFHLETSLILSGSAVARNIKNSNYQNYGIDGFIKNTADIPFNPNRGFNLNYAEVGLHSHVGSYFNATAIFHLNPDIFEIDEAYISSKKLPANLELKAGSFKSGFGRINAIHPHEQHFSTFPLIYEAMLGAEGLKETGLSLQWKVPLEKHLVIGIETLQGNNQQSFGYPEENNLYVGYLKSRLDIMEHSSIYTGASIAKGKTPNNQSSKLYGAELSLKHHFSNNDTLLWQNEYLYRNKNQEQQAGFYTQLLYNFNQEWELGTRYDSIHKNIPNQPNNLKRYSSILTYTALEHSKFRLQYTKDQSKSFLGKRQDEHQILLEFLIELEPHHEHE